MVARQETVTSTPKKVITRNQITKIFSSFEKKISETWETSKTVKLEKHKTARPTADSLRPPLCGAKQRQQAPPNSHEKVVTKTA